MSITAAYDKTLFYNEASKYCVLRLKTADLMVPEDARSTYKFSDRLIRFVAVGYDLPRTDSIKIELEGIWSNGKYTLLWKGQKLNVTVTPRMVQINSEKQDAPICLEVWGKEYDFDEELIVIKKNT